MKWTNKKHSSPTQITTTTSMSLSVPISKDCMEMVGADVDDGSCKMKP